MSHIPRIYQKIPAPVQQHISLTLEGNAAHYLAHVLRKKAGEQLKIFGENYGEFLAEITSVSKKHVEVGLIKKLRAFKSSPDILLLFAPVKNEKIDFIARRATELGVSVIQPIRTKHTIVTRINEERMLANMVEAAEQCERMDVPELKPFVSLHEALSNWNKERILFVGDECGKAMPVHTVLPAIPRGQKAALLIGPEGGFSKEEHGLFRTLPYIKPFTLGPRILRAETAVLVGLAHLQAWLGDGDQRPKFELLETL